MEKGRRRRGTAMQLRQEHLSCTFWLPVFATGQHTSSAQTRHGQRYTDQHRTREVFANLIQLKVIISDATVPGEGEHKIMQFIRSQRSSPAHDPNTRHVFYGLDADLIMLGLATHEPHFRILREDVFAQDTKPGTCRICNQPGHMAAECRGVPAKKNGDFGEKQDGAPQKSFIWLHVTVLREYLAIEMSVPNQPFRFDLERALDDWVFMCFFVGNDFLPHLPSLDIREQGIDTLIAIWKDNIPTMGGYVTKDGHIDLSRAQLILEGLAKQEDAIFRRRREAEKRKEAGAKRRKMQQDRNRQSEEGSFAAGAPAQNALKYPGSKKRGEAIPDINALPTFSPGSAQTANDPRYMTHDMVVNKANAANKSAAAVLKEKLKNKEASPQQSQKSAVEELMNSVQNATPPSALGKRRADLMEDGDSTPGRSTPEPAVADPTVAKDPVEPAEDTVRMWEDGYADRYYEQKFKVSPSDHEFRHQLANDYVEGLAWVLLYYIQGCPSWTWYFPHHYAPFAADFTDLAKLTISFEKGKPFRPYEQLMGVMPVGSNHTIPEAFHPLMTDADSDIVHYYPEDFEIDLNGKKFAWQGVALLPFIDEKRLLDAMATKYPLLSKEEHERNEVGKEALLFSNKHPLYDEVALHFYSKKAGAPKISLNAHVSEGLSGKVEKNESYLPSSSLVFPLPNGGMPDLDEDGSVSVFYAMPPNTGNHKSMLMAGVKLPPPVLDHNDIETTRSRSNQNGRGYGGAPLENGRGGRINYGGGRGGRDNYSNGRGDSYGGGRGNDRYDGGRGGGNNGYGGHQGNGYGGHHGNGYQSGPPPGMPFANLPPQLAQQAAAHGFPPPPGFGPPPPGFGPPPHGWNGQMPPMPPPPQNGYGGYGGQGYNNGYGGGRGGRGGGGRY